MAKQTKNRFQVVIILQVIVLSRCQGNEALSMSATACDPSQEDCDCLDTQPPTMTLTCPQIVENNLCDLPAVADEDYCKLSCGTCGKCSTSMLGCQCLTKWEFEGGTYSGCDNPDSDDAGSWCEIDQGSCEEYKPKKYDYCLQDCSVIDLGKTTQQPSPVSQTTSKDTSPALPNESASIKEPLQIAALSKSKIAVVNQGNSQEYVDEIYLRTSWDSVELEDCNYDSYYLDPKDSIVVPLILEDYDEDYYGDDDCYLELKSFTTTELSIVDSSGQIKTEVDLKQFPLSSLDDSNSYCLKNGEFTLISKQLCEYLL